MGAEEMPDRLIAVVREAMFENLPKPQRAIVVSMLRALAGPERGRANHVLYTGNTLHTLADMTETQDSA